MDAASVAVITQTAVSLLLPYLKSIGEEFAKGLGKEIGTDAGETVLQKTKKLYGAIKKKFSSNEETSTILTDFEKKPDDADVQGAIRHYLKRYIENDKTFSDEIASLVADISKIAGTTSVSQSTIIGDVQEYVQAAEKYLKQGDLSHSIGVVKDSVIVLGDDFFSRLPDTQKGTVSPKTQEVQFISVNLKCNRFNRIFRLRIQKELRIEEFIELLIERIQLPEKRMLEELMIQFDFIYFLAHDEEIISPDKSFEDAGIRNGAALELKVKGVWVDKIEEAEYEEAALGPTTYDEERVLELIRRDVAKRTRGRINQKKIESLGDSILSSVDSIETDDNIEILRK